MLDFDVSAPDVILFSISGLKSWFAMVKRGVMGIDEDCTIGLR